MASHLGRAILLLQSVRISQTCQSEGYVIDISGYNASLGIASIVFSVVSRDYTLKAKLKNRALQFFL
jgi:hypothetical protein